jgi:hypothetical protein
MSISKAIILTALISASALASTQESSFISDTYSALPQSMKSIVNLNNTKVSFGKLNDVELNTPCDDKEFIFGKHNNSKIVISSKLRPHLSDEGKQDFSCKHKSFYKTAKATLLHEFLHAYEDKIKNKLSDDLEFKSLGFWKLKKRSKNMNTYADRSPNKYEYHSPKEFVAVNFEYFMLDPQFKCRRPNLYSAFSKRLNHIPFKNSTCSSVREISYSNTRNVKSLSLNFNEVREIHYLFASKGKAIMSRWGHSMFKIVSCPTTWSTADCRKKGKFAVVGFLAQVNDVNLNALKGVFGDYPSDLVITDIDSMKRQYNRAELRDLMSLPIKFTKNQKERFLNHLLRVYWEYSGRYYFFTNNCADEAFKFLQIAYNKKEIYKKKVLTPLGILKFVKKENIIADYQFDKTKENIKSGLLYESFQAKLDRSYDAIFSKYKDLFKQKKKTPNVRRPERKFRDQYTYIDDISKYSELDTYKRRSIIESIADEGTKKDILNLFAIESQANYVTGNKLLKKMQSQTSKLSEIEETQDIFQEMVELKNIILFGSNTTEKGYGIPQQGDLSQVVSQEAIYAQEDLVFLKDELQTIYKDIFKDIFNSLEESNENKTIIKKALRRVL